MTLADEIEDGGGSDEAVARALGWRRVQLGREQSDGWLRKGRDGGDDIWRFWPPAFLTDLNALAAECERRGHDWIAGQCQAHPSEPPCSATILHRKHGLHVASGAAPTPARALCAALLRAVESEADDGR